MHLFHVPVIGLLLTLAAGCALMPQRGPTVAEQAEGRTLAASGIAAADAGQWDQAEPLLLQALERTPDDATSRRYLAEALWKRGAYEEALVQIGAAQRADEHSAEIALRAGEMRLAARSFDLAAQYASEAIRNNPEVAAAWALRGQAYWRMNQIERALADFQKALELSPNDRELLADIAGLYRQIGQPTRSLTTIQRLIDSYPPGGAPQSLLLIEGVTLQELRRPQQAAESFAAALNAGPPNADIYCRLAEAQIALGRPELAAQATKAALAIDPSHAAGRALNAQLASRSESEGVTRR